MGRQIPSTSYSAIFLECSLCNLLLNDSWKVSQTTAGADGLKLLRLVVFKLFSVKQHSSFYKWNLIWIPNIYSSDLTFSPSPLPISSTPTLRKPLFGWSRDYMNRSTFPKISTKQWILVMMSDVSRYWIWKRSITKLILEVLH